MEPHYALWESIPNMGQIPPCNHFMLGHQHDSGPYWCALATSPHGPIPAKARQGKAWYPWGGKEHPTDQFTYLRMKPEKGGHLTMVHANNGQPPHNALDVGKMFDGSVYYMVICHSQHGDIPGKAKGREGWYSYDGKEHKTHDFSYVVAQGRTPGMGLYPGSVVRLTSKSHGKNLRLQRNGEVDGRGGTGEWATWRVQGRGPYVALHLANHAHRFLAIKNGTLTHGTGGKFCTFKVQAHGDGTISLESVAHPNTRVGVRENGDHKPPHETFTGQDGCYYVNFA